MANDDEQGLLPTGKMYENGRCWYGDPTQKKGKGPYPHASGICGVQGAPLYTVGKGEMGVGTCRMYLCNTHVKTLQHLGFTLTKVVEY